MPDNVLGVLFQDIANAIRTKTGGTDTMKPAEFPTEIANIPVGGGSVEGVHFVTFMSEDGTKELYKRPVADGDDCADIVTRGLISTPTKESTVSQTFTYSGWSLTDGGAASSNALKAVTEDRTVYAAFKATARKYTARFYDDSGALMQESQVAYGTQATPPDTTKDGYTFNGWTPSDLTIYVDTDFYGTWTETKYELLDNPADLLAHVYDGAIHPVNGQLALTESDSKSAATYLNVYNIDGETPTKLFSLDTGLTATNAIITYNPDGTRLALANNTSGAYGVQIYDTTTTPYTLLGATSLDYFVQSLLYSSDGTKLFVGLLTSYFITLDATQIPYVATDNVLTWDIPHPVTSIAYNPDKTILALGANSQAYTSGVCFYDTTTTPYTVLATFTTHRCYSITFNPNGTSAVTGNGGTGSYDGSKKGGRVYDINGTTIAEASSQPLTIGYRMKYTYNPIGNRLVGSSLYNGATYCYNTTVTPYVSMSNMFEDVPESYIRNVFFNNNGSRLIIVSDVTTPPLYIYNTEIDMVSK